MSAAMMALLLSGCGGSDAMAQTPLFTLSSPDLAGGTVSSRFVLNGFGCTGNNVSPALIWANAPAGTRSFAVTMYDPDAPTGSGFWHWTVFNLPASANGLAQGAGNAATTLPAPAYAGSNDFFDTGTTNGNGNYGGPCPPAGDAPHRYVFTVYSLAVESINAAAGIPRTGTAGLHGFALNRGLGANVLAKASFFVTYGR